MSFDDCLRNSEDLPAEEKALREALFRLVQSITTNDALRDDLLQEALIHLWLTQARRPAQTRSWYLQSCKFHLQHYLASGRSVDSTKRSAGQLQFAPNAEEDFFDDSDAGNTVFTSVSARDIISLLSRHLLPQEKAVLLCLADGLGPREIGLRLQMSHTMVIKHRRRIAVLLTRLENSRPLLHAPRAAGSGHGNGTGLSSVTPADVKPVNGDSNATPQTGEA